MTLRFLVFDQTSSYELIQAREFQSTEFTPGKALAEWLVSPRAQLNGMQLAPVHEAGGIFLFSGEADASKNFLIVDYERAPVFQGMSRPDALLVLQRLLRFVVKYWTKGRLSPSYERLIPDSTKAVLFPFPYSQQTAFRVVIEREPDKKRLQRRSELGNFLLVYKCGHQEGEGPREVPELTNFRKAIDALPAARNRAAEAVRTEETRQYATAALGVTALEPPAGNPLSPYMGFDNWEHYLTDSQREFVHARLRKPHRIEGPAGTGKTLALTLKCIATLRRAVRDRQDHKALFVTHSEPTRDHIEELFAANEPHASRFSDTDSRVRVQISTLQLLCTEILQRDISPTELLDRDAHEAKLMTALYIEEAVDEAKRTLLPSYDPLLSAEFATFLRETDSWTLSEMLAHEISVVIKGRARENLELYKRTPALRYGLPVRNDSDRGFVFQIFKQYQDALQKAGQFDVDDIILTAASQLDTPIWRRRRNREAFDSIFIDETHLFNMNELSVFHFLTKELDRFQIAYSVDRSQAIGDRGWELFVDEEPSVLLAGIDERVEATHVSSIFRSSSQVLNLAFSITAGGATLFTNFQNPLEAAQTALTNEEEDRAALPSYIECRNDEEMIIRAFSIAAEMAAELNVRRAEVCVVVCSEPLLEGIRSYAAEKNKPSEILTRRGDAALVARAVQTNRFVVAGVDYVGGLEFAGVVLVGVDDGRVPPLVVPGASDSKSYLSYVSHNRLYVAVTRARYRVTVLGVAERGPSELLRNAFALNLIERRQ